MIKSKYVTDIIDLLLDVDGEGMQARKQLEYVIDDDYEYTGGGLFVRFKYLDGIKNFKVGKDDLILNGVKIETTEFPIEANATLFFKHGILDYVEIWCYSGDYPKQELTKYTLTQIWENSPKKIITTEQD